MFMFLKLSELLKQNFCKFRITIGSGACKIAQTEEVQQFVGRCVEEEVPIQCVKKSSEKKMAKLSWILLKKSPYFSFLQIWKKNPLSLCDVQIITGNAVKTKRGELGNSGEAVQFLNSKNEVQNTFTLFFWEKLNPQFT